MSDVHRGADFSDLSAPDDKPGEVMTTCTQCGRIMTAPGGYLCDHTQYESENQQLREALKRCCEVIENDVRQLRREGFEGASWQLDAIRKARRFVETTDPLSDIGVTLEDR